VGNDNEKNVLPPPPPITREVPGLPDGPPPGVPQGKPIAVQIDIDTYKELMSVLQEMPYKLVGPVMSKLAPGVKAIFEAVPEIVDDPDGESAE
jgi:hypothetical protein